MEPGKKKSKAATGSRRRIRKSTKTVSNASLSVQHDRVSVKENKLVAYLNALLSMENASLDRLQLRINEIRLEGPKAQLQHHLEETVEQQARLKKLLIGLGAKPTEDKALLSIPFMPKTVNDLRRENKLDLDYELLRTREDAILESAEIINYHFALLLVRNAAMVEAIRPLSQNMTEEISMADWIKSNIPSVITHYHQPEIADSNTATTTR